MQWCDVAVQFWRGAEHVERVAREPHAHLGHAGGEHHGSYPAGEYPALRHVHEHGQPDGGGGHCGGIGGVDAHALHSRHGLALDTRRADHAAGQYAVAGCQLFIDVQLGRGDQGGDAGSDADADSLTGR